MPTFVSPLDLYRHQKAAFDTTERTSKQAYRQIGEGAFRDLRELTSGEISTAELRSMGHPFARQGASRRGASKSYISRKSIAAKAIKDLAPLLPINRQSGRLQRSIKLIHRSNRYTAEDSVYFDPLIAGFSIYSIKPDGTNKVVPRGLQAEARTRSMARLKAYQDVFFQGQRQAFATA